MRYMRLIVALVRLSSAGSTAAMLRDPERGLDLLAHRHDAVDEPDLVGALRADLILAGEQDLPSRAWVR